MDLGYSPASCQGLSNPAQAKAWTSSQGSSNPLEAKVSAFGQGSSNPAEAKRPASGQGSSLAAMAATSERLELSAETLARFGCQPPVARRLLAMWLREAGDSEEECLDDFLESKYFRLSQQLCDKVITKKHPLYKVVCEELHWLKVAVIDILEMHTVWFTDPMYDEFREELEKP